MRILSLGAGVQSSTLALMIKHGEVPMVDAAIFADTGAEPRGVYTYLDWLESVLPFPVHRVQKDAGLLENIKQSVAGGRFAGAPFFTHGDREGRLRRQCTTEFKIDPIKRKVRELVGLSKGQRAPRREILVTQYIGISWDEVQRMKPSTVPWITHEWPLIDRRMTRADCLRWIWDRGYPLPNKSSCTFCPYHDAAAWRDIKLHDPESWAQAVEVDRLIRNGVRGTTQKLYLHRSLRPLEDIDFRNAEDAGQMSMFTEECTGMCGV